MIGQEERKHIEKIQKDLDRLDTPDEKRKYLYRQIADVVKSGILKDDPEEGKKNPVYRYIAAELRYFKILSQIK